MYGDAVCIDGPASGVHVPFVGRPRYGVMVQLDYFQPGKKRGKIAIYRVTQEFPGELSYVGTLGKRWKPPLQRGIDMGFIYSSNGSDFERWEDEASGFAVERHNLTMSLEGDFKNLDRHGVENVQRILDAAKDKLPSIQV